MHGSNITRGGILPSIQPFVIARADFEKLYPVYQKMALALVQTGKVLIVDYSQPSTVSYACQPSTALPAKRDPSFVSGTCHKKPVGMLVHPRKGFFGLGLRGGVGGDPQRGRLAAPSLGYYRLIRNTACVKVEE